MTYVLYAILSAFFAALVAIFAKVGLKSVDPTVATMMRVLIMAVFFALVVTGLNKWKYLAQIDSAALYWIVLSGVAGALSWLFYFLALRDGSAAAVVGIDRTSVAMVLILSIVFLGEGFTWQAGVGALLVTAGAIMLTLR